MDSLRIILATVLFCLSAYLCCDLFANGFDWIVLAVATAGFFLTHIIWPKDARDEGWFDILEFIVDLPYRSIALFVRSLGRLFRDGDIGVDL